MISDRAVVADGAQLGERVSIAPFAVIESGVSIGPDCSIAAHAVLRSGTSVGAGCRIGAGVVIGEAPSDTAYSGEPTGVSIGRNNDIKEYVTIHRATGPGLATQVGDYNLIMPYVHVAHNCRIGSRTIITNACQLAGHVQVQDNAFLGGLSGVHQFTRIGAFAMLGACSYLTQDLPPFTLAAGNPCLVRGLNVVGLRRAGFGPDETDILSAAFRAIYRSRLNLGEALKRLPELAPGSAHISRLVEFLRTSRRGILLKTPQP